MVRSLRIEYDGAWYHVMNRGQAKRPVFLDDADRKFFLMLLGDISTLFPIEIHAFSLMENHYHLLIHTPKAGLSRAMRHLNGLYTQNFNARHGRDGALFRGRYKAILVQSDDYLCELVRYIHNNPVKAGVSKKSAAHLWTSHCYYLDSKSFLPWLKTEEVLSRFSKKTKLAKQMLDAFITSNQETDDPLFFESPKHGVIGADDFRSWIKNNFIKKSHQQNRQIKDSLKKDVSSKSITQILERIAFSYNVGIAELRDGKSGKKNEPRSLAIYILRQYRGLSHKQIARWLNVKNENAVAQIFYRVKKLLSKDQKMTKFVRNLATEALAGMSV